MGQKFWFGYIAFFVFIFPLFFSYSGSFMSSPIVSTIALGVGLIGWLIFISWTYAQTIARPRKLRRNIIALVDEGRLTRGKILDKILLKKQKDGSQVLEIVVEFQNLSNTLVKNVFEFTDSRPHERRFEVGNNINLRLSTTQQSPGIVMADIQTKFSWKFGLIATSFVVLYMVGTFIVHYRIFSEGNGWRFISFWHPWVMTPYMGLFFFNMTKMIGRFFGGKHAHDEDLLLYGKKATAIVQRAEQTGTYINEQPQMKYILKFTDDKGVEHVVTLKRIVLLTDLHRANTGTQNILYLPDDPEKITFVD